jgi:hypothetical protein
VPPNPPVEQYWSVTAYDRQIHALIRNMPRLMFRAYAPTKALFEKTWVLPDVERVAAQ